MYRSSRKYGLDLEAIHRFLCSILHTLNSIRHFHDSIRHFPCSLHHFLFLSITPSYPHTFLYNFYPPHSNSSPPTPAAHQPKQKAHQQQGELSDNLLILIFGFEGAFHFAFGFFFAHVVTFIVVFFPFADAD